MCFVENVVEGMVSKMFQILIKLVVAAVAGGILGLEREAKHKPLGLKTCIVISVSSCLLTVVSIEIATNPYTSQLVRADPMRLASQIVSGIGFLGAGVILRKNNDAISGLTTAAIVWAASVLGIAVGAGYYIETGIGVALIFIGIKALPFIMKHIGPRAMREQGVKITVQINSNMTVRDTVKKIRELDIRVKDTKIIGNQKTHWIELHCTVLNHTDYIFTTYENVYSIEGINQVEIEEL